MGSFKNLIKGTTSTWGGSKERADSGNLTSEASSGRSSRDNVKRSHRAEPDAGQSSRREVPLTGPIDSDTENVISHKDTDSEMHPPSSQSNKDMDPQMHRPSSPSRVRSPDKHQAQLVTKRQAQSDTGPNPVPSKTKDNITSEGSTKQGHQGRQEDGHPWSEQRTKQDRQTQEYKTRLDREEKARETEMQRREQVPKEHPAQGKGPRYDREAKLQERGEEQGGRATNESRGIRDGEAEAEGERLPQEQQYNDQKAEKETRRQDLEVERKAHIDQRWHELAVLKTQVAEAASHFNELSQINRHLKGEVDRLNAEWNHDLQLLESQRQVLNASRSFAAREGTLDAATLIQSFNDLNSSIGDLSFEILRGLDDTADTRPLEERDYKGVFDALTDQNLKFFVEQLAHRDLKASDVVDPIVTGIITADLLSTIFSPFAPGLDKDRSDVLQRMYRKMRESEPQERSARWRSITYNHAVPNPEPDFLQQAANTSISTIMGVLTALSGGRKITSTNEYYELARRIFEAAVKVQDRAKKEYVSFDYEVYSVPAKTTYVRREMDISQAGNTAPLQVWITIGLGMKAHRNIQGERGGLRFECSIPVKPTVICDNWDHNV